MVKPQNQHHDQVIYRVEIHFSVKLCSSWTIVKNSLLLDPFFWPNVQWILWNQVCKHDQLFNSLTLLASVLNCTPIKISDFRLKPQQLLMNISWNRVVVERRNVLRRYGKLGYKKQHNWHWCLTSQLRSLCSFLVVVHTRLKNTYQVKKIVMLLLRWLLREILSLSRYWINCNREGTKESFRVERKHGTVRRMKTGSLVMMLAVATVVTASSRLVIYN